MLGASYSFRSTLDFGYEKLDPQAAHNSSVANPQLWEGQIFWLWTSYSIWFGSPAPPTKAKNNKIC